MLPDHLSLQYNQICIITISLHFWSRIQLTPNNSNLLGKLKKVQVRGSLSYQEFKGNGMGNERK